VALGAVCALLVIVTLAAIPRVEFVKGVLFNILVGIRLGYYSVLRLPAHCLLTLVHAFIEPGRHWLVHLRCIRQDALPLFGVTHRGGHHPHAWTRISIHLTLNPTAEFIRSPSIFGRL
jgi:hypothetical protein